MAYIPPFGGGHFNATLGGNSTSAGAGYAQISTGTLTIAGGNNVTLSQNGNALTISAFNQSAQTQSNIQALYDGANSITTGTVRLSNSNGVSFGLNGQTLTASVAAQSNPNLSFYATGNTTGGSSSSQLNGSSLMFNGLGGVSVGYSNGSVEISGASGGGAQGTDVIGGSNLNNVQGNTGVVSGTGVQMLFAGSNITLSQSLNGVSGTMTISAASQSSPVADFQVVGNTTYNTTATVNIASQVISAVGGISAGFTNLGALVLSAPNQSNPNISFYGTGNTTQNSSSVLNASSVLLNGLGAASVGYSNGSLEISVPTQSAQTQSNIQALYDGANSVSTGTVRLSNANGVSFGLNGQTLTGSVAAQSNQNISLYASGNTTQNSSSVLNASSLLFNGLGNMSVGFSNGSVQLSVTGGGGGGGGIALANSQTTFTSGTVNLSETGAITIASTTGQSFQISVPATSSLANTGIVSLSTNGSTISIGAPAFSAGVSTLGSTSGNTGTVSNQLVFAGSNITLSQSTAAGGATVTISGAAGGGGGGGTLQIWEPMQIGAGSLSNVQKGNGSVFFYPLHPQAYVTATHMLQLLSVSMSTSSRSSYAAAISIGAGIFTITGSTLSLITQSSGTTNYAFTNTSSNSMSVVSGLRGLSIPMNVNMSPGNYWIGMWSNTSSTNANWASVSNIVFAVNNSSYYAHLGQAANNTVGVQEAAGYWSASTSAFPSSAAVSALTQSVIASNAMPYMIFKNTAW